MGEAGYDLDLALEAIGADHARQLGPQDLDGDPTIVLTVVRQVHHRHGARAELMLDRVTGGECGTYGRAHAVHGRGSSLEGGPWGSTIYMGLIVTLA
jgi:hypothetical protein